jgi:hypothetical protein
LKIWLDQVKDNKVNFTIKPDLNPTIYAYEDSHPEFNGLLKIGYTNINAKKRVSQQYPIVRPSRTWKILLEESAFRKDGSIISDHEVIKCLKKKGFKNPKGEWVKCNIKNIHNVLIELKENRQIEKTRYLSFKMRPEQKKAVSLTSNYFKSVRRDQKKTPHFLWNAKMRFGKTFASYQLALAMNWKKILVLTFKPAVQNAWQDDLTSHVDFNGWSFVTKDELKQKQKIKYPIVCFGSFQDFLGKNSVGGIKSKNEWAHSINWDCIILDEYHYGAWRENAKELFESEDKKEANFLVGSGLEFYDQDSVPLTTDHFLYLSGTPFRALETGEFIEEQIFNWTYADEQKAKINWKGQSNPYLAMPKMAMLTYQIPENLKNVAIKGEFNEFDLNTFFLTEKKNNKPEFKFKNEVQKWLDLIRGSYKGTLISDLKMKQNKPPFPYSDSRLKNILMHTLWFMPTVDSCVAMNSLLKENQNFFYHDYNINIAAGVKAGIGVQALYPVLESMTNPTVSKTITLSCGKLTTGVTVKPWTGIFMLRNTTAPETYFQSAFRVQSPWTIINDSKKSPNKEIILKKECYIFDFSPNRALKLIADYSCRLNPKISDPEKAVNDFIKFLPVLCFDGSSMKDVNASEILDISSSGTTATLLARRWESALLVNVDNLTLDRLLKNKLAIEALMQIEGFRSLNKDIEAVINKTSEIKSIKKEANEKDLDKVKKKILSDSEKEQKSMRKKIQEKLIKFATRIPVFMYLTDHREKTLKDVINELEPGLFKKVTGLFKKDFQLLLSLGVFNSARMNDAVYKFKRYEDRSLSYLGIITHEKTDIGLFDTVISKKEFYKETKEII